MTTQSHHLSFADANVTSGIPIVGQSPHLGISERSPHASYFSDSGLLASTSANPMPVLSASTKVLMQRSRDAIRNLQIELKGERDRRQQVLSDLSVLQKDIEQQNTVNKAAIAQSKLDLSIMEEKEERLTEQLQRTQSSEQKWRQVAENAAKELSTRQIEFEQAQRSLREKLDAEMLRSEQLTSKLREEEISSSTREKNREVILKEAESSVKHANLKSTQLHQQLIEITAKADYLTGQIKEKDDEIKNIKKENSSFKIKISEQEEKMSNLIKQLHSKEDTIQKLQNSREENDGSKRGHESREKNLLDQVEQLQEELTSSITSAHSAANASAEAALQTATSACMSAFNEWKSKTSLKVTDIENRVEKLALLVQKTVKTVSSKYKSIKSERKREKTRREKLERDNSRLLTELNEMRYSSSKLSEHYKSFRESISDNIPNRLEISKLEDLSQKLLQENKDKENQLRLVDQSKEAAEQKLNEYQSEIRDLSSKLTSRAEERNTLLRLLAMYGLCDVANEKIYSGSGSDLDDDDETEAYTSSNRAFLRKVEGIVRNLQKVFNNRNAR